MTNPNPSLDLAVQYHNALPGRIRQYLNSRGVPDLQIDAHQLGWNGFRITIPIFNRAGELAFFKLAKDPEDTSGGPKMRRRVAEEPARDRHLRGRVRPHGS